MEAPTFSPREIVGELDRFIVGQDDAKRAVAIALRNRWRRAQLPEAMRDEVVPKNILMIGPTGCGKTEISRRLAQTGQCAVPEGRSHQVHGGRLCGTRRRADLSCATSSRFRCIMPCERAEAGRTFEAKAAGSAAEERILSALRWVGQ